MTWIHWALAVLSLMLAWPAGLIAILFAGLSASSRRRWDASRSQGDPAVTAALHQKAERFRLISAITAAVGLIIIVGLVVILMLGQGATTNFSQVGTSIN